MSEPITPSGFSGGLNQESRHRRLDCFLVLSAKKSARDFVARDADVAKNVI
ncbi:hypothetical protein [Mesorhizobium sp.]|uniref:hypothetical protein n=1 Tax=Mesorhizobium sp. TaxID=1871066 RepID=UPI0025C54F7A|nr:hypothetical protein [Mesorhizobium sp.]